MPQQETFNTVDGKLVAGVSYLYDPQTGRFFGLAWVRSGKEIVSSIDYRQHGADEVNVMGEPDRRPFDRTVR